MWQSFEQDTATPLPEGYSRPAGYAIATFAAAPPANTTWNAATRDFHDPASTPTVTPDDLLQWVIDQIGGDIAEARRQVEHIAIRKGR